MNKPVLPISFDKLNPPSQSRNTHVKNESGSQRFSDSFELSRTELNNAARNDKQLITDRKLKDKLEDRALESRNSGQSKPVTHTNTINNKVEKSESTKECQDTDSQLKSASVQTDKPDSHTSDAISVEEENSQEPSVTDPAVTDPSVTDPALLIVQAAPAQTIENVESTETAVLDLVPEVEQTVAKGSELSSSAVDGKALPGQISAEMMTEDSGIESVNHEDNAMLKKSLLDTDEQTQDAEKANSSVDQPVASSLGATSDVKLVDTSGKAGLSAMLEKSEGKIGVEIKADGKNLPLDDQKMEGELDTKSLEVKLESKNGKTDKTEFAQLLTKDSVEDKPLADKQAATSLNSSAGANSSAPANRLFVPQTQVNVAVPHPHWGNAVGEKILWMANQQLSSADIRLDPPELGSLQVRVSVQQDQANVTFISPHPQVRELLDQQVNRLREMFAEQGLQLGQVNIADRREQHSQDSQGNSQNNRQFFQNDTEAEVISSSPISSLYLVDQFV